MEIGIALTDEEVLALASRSGTPWPTALPTIDLTDAAETQASANRGVRSLLVRDLLQANPEGLPLEGLQTLVNPIVRGKALMGTYVATKDYQYLPLHAATVRDDVGNGTCVSEVTSGAGIHYIRSSTTDFWMDATLKMLSAVFRSGVPEEPSEDGVRDLVLAAVGPTSNETLRMAAVVEGRNPRDSA